MFEGYGRQRSPNSDKETIKLDWFMLRFRNRNSGWQFALILCVFLKYIYDLKKLTFYGFYLYFYLASFVCYLYTLTNWEEIRAEALILQYKFLNRKSLEVKWQDIESIKIEKILIAEKDAGDGRFNISYYQEVEFVALRINMHIPISLSIKNVVKKTQGYSYLTNRMEMGRDNFSFMVLSEPANGFSAVIEEAQSFVKTEIQCKIKANSAASKLAKSSFNMLIFIFGIYGFFWGV